MARRVVEPRGFADAMAPRPGSRRALLRIMRGGGAVNGISAPLLCAAKLRQLLRDVGRVDLAA